MLTRLEVQYRHIKPERSVSRFIELTVGQTVAGCATRDGNLPRRNVIALVRNHGFKLIVMCMTCEQL